MNIRKPALIIHTILRTLSIGVPAVFLLIFLIKYASYPDTIGVHFDAEGNFDLYSDKYLGFHPFIVILISQLVFSAVIFFAKKSTVAIRGLDLSEKTRCLFKEITLIWIDIMGLGISAFFSMFAFCVTWQIPEPVKAALPIFYGYLILLFLFLAVAVIVGLTGIIVKIFRK